MILIAGLGNYKSQYLKNRHNVGFHFIDHLINKYSFEQNSKIENKIDAFCFEGECPMLLENLQNNFNNIQNLKNKKDRLAFDFPKDTNFTLIKPKTFMNGSGISLLKYVSLYKPSLIIVAYDDIETLIGQFKININSNGSGGHNGIRSIIASIGSNFIKLKIGIKNNNIDDLADFVLSNFNQEEFEIIQNIIFKIF